jgi:hypothetical protein
MLPYSVLSCLVGLPALWFLELTLKDPTPVQRRRQRWGSDSRLRRAQLARHKVVQEQLVAALQALGGQCCGDYAQAKLAGG